MNRTLRHLGALGILLASTAVPALLPPTGAHARPIIDPCPPAVMARCQGVTHPSRQDMVARHRGPIHCSRNPAGCRRELVWEHG